MVKRPEKKVTPHTLGIILIAIVLFIVVTYHFPEPEGEYQPSVPIAETPTVPSSPTPAFPQTEPAPDEVGELLDELEQRRRGMAPITTQNTYEIADLPIGTYIGRELSAISEEQFGIRKIYTQHGSTTHRQYVRFGESGQDIVSGRVEFTENQFGQVGAFLTFQEGDIMYEYGIIFDGGLESEIEDRQLEDLHNKELVIAGKRALITGSRITTSNNRVQLRLTTGSKSVTLKEGETRRVFAGFSAPSVSAVHIGSGNAPQVILSIDGRQTPALRAGQRILYDDGLSLSILQVLPNEAGDGKDTVLFVLGSSALTLEDTYNDDAFSTSVEINGRSQPGSLVQIKGSVQNDLFRIDSIKFRAEAQEDIHVAPGLPLSETDDRSTATTGVDIDYSGLSKVNTALIKFRPAGEGYRLSFFSNNGNGYTIPLLDASGTFRYGDSSRTLWWTEGSSDTDYQVAERDYLVLTSASTHKGITNVVQYRNLDTANKQVTFTDLAGGERTVTYTDTGVAGQLGQGTLSFSRINARFTVGSNGNIAMDLNGDSDIGGDAVDIVTLGGGIIDLGSAQGISGDSTVTMTLTTQRTKIQDASSDEAVQITLTRDGSDLDVRIPTGQSALRMRDAGDDIEQGLTVYGALFELGQVSGDRSILTIEYPVTQRFVDVRVQS